MLAWSDASERVSQKLEKEGTASWNGCRIRIPGPRREEEEDEEDEEDEDEDEES